ncbi:uncharacterized protein LOC129226726 [Uloborus diversus]|uniref:uncharacterized protein LOC129226726 n=1 Tax=Uloborus diversus TaxID=327109 RepID=UPI00240950FB|nr:uncharacterized protein LOC129226726 [Uloborus diversus]
MENCQRGCSYREFTFAGSKTIIVPNGISRSDLQVVTTMHKLAEDRQRESYRIPILISAPGDASHEIPVKLELYDDDRHIKSSPDVHPIEPIHVVRVADQHYQHAPPPVYHGPVAVPVDYPYGNEVSNTELQLKNYGDLSAIPGSPGVDYPTYSYLPTTGFECMEHTSTPGFYADVETKCQMWHYCQPDGRHDRFLCPNGTVFDQYTRVCNWWFNVRCDNSLSLYDINFDLYREPRKLALQTLDYHHQDSPSLQLYESHHAEEPSVTLQNLDYHRERLLSDSYHNEVPKASDYQSRQAAPSSAETPNSFLRHVKDFEAGVVHNVQPEHYVLPIPSAASPQAVHRYPAKIAPAPKVHHDYGERGVIDYDSSNSYTQATPSETPRIAKKEGEKRKRKHKKRVLRRKVRKHPKIYSKHDGEDIPTYREGKATPAGKRFRVVRRRKSNKS